MLRGRLNVLHWPLRVKLAVLFVLAVFVPVTLVAVPFASQRREVLLRDQAEAQLETLGPFGIAQAERTFQALGNQTEQMISPLTRFQGLNPDLAETIIRSGTAEGPVMQLMLDRASLVRVRLMAIDNTPIIDAHRQNDGNIEFNYYDETYTAPTRAEQLIAEGRVSEETMLTNIYPGLSGDPVIDVVLPFQTDDDTTISDEDPGYAVFTYDLLLTAQDEVIPDVYRTLLDIPKTDQPHHICLLNDRGQLLSPTEDFDVWSDMSASPGFGAAQRGETGISEYTSMMLNADVMSYHAAVDFTNGPRITFLIETPTDYIEEQAFEEGLFTLAIVSSGVIVLGLAATMLGASIVTRPLNRLTFAARQIVAGQFDVELAEMNRRDEIGQLNNALSQMIGQLLHAVSELEAQVDERTRNLELTLEIGRAVTSIRDLDQLLETVVNLIRDQFDTIYHAQIFLVDARTRQAQLRASTGVVGRQLLQHGHYLEVGSQSVIGSVTAAGHAVIALDTSHNPIHKRNEFLPDTRAEMALPLRTGNRIIGALDLQSTRPDAFSQHDVDLFQGMADQLTIAIENATLFAESTARLHEIEHLNRSLTQTAWHQVEQGREQRTLNASVGLAETAVTWSPLQLEAIQKRAIAEHIEDNIVTFAVPVMLRDQVLGAVEWQVPLDRYSQNTRQTALELTSRLALTAENIRLFEQSRRVAQREALVNQISNKLTVSTDVNQILQIAVRELGLALQSSETVIKLQESTFPTENDSIQLDE
ncbi:MAG: GAF domain-containing protein [Chloroflexi bacterium]|nr:GAF domain-containing protein [Chloroflexota bacterium]